MKSQCLSRVIAGVPHRNFYEAYAKRFGHHLNEMPTEVLSWRLDALLANRVPTPSYAKNGKRARVRCEPISFRSVYYVERGRSLRTPVYKHGLLSEGDRISGPAIIEQVESTAVIGPADKCIVDKYRNLVLSIVPEKAKLARSARSAAR